jgi:hypothetical protein
METIEEVLEFTLTTCEGWQVEERTTRKGKVRTVACAIPTKAFWRRWKLNKDKPAFVMAWKYIAGQCICLERRRPTGQFVCIKGRQVELKRSQWEIVIGVNARTEHALTQAGILAPPDPLAGVVEGAEYEDTLDPSCPF